MMQAQGLCALDPSEGLCLGLRPSPPSASTQNDRQNCAVECAVLLRFGSLRSPSSSLIPTAHWCTFGSEDAKLRSGGVSPSPSICCDGHHRTLFDGLHENRRTAGAGRRFGA